MLPKAQRRESPHSSGKGVFNIDLDSGNGSLKKAIVVVLIVAAIICGWLARTEWRRVHTAAGAPT